MHDTINGITVGERLGNSSEGWSQVWTVNMAIFLSKVSSSTSIRETVRLSYI